MPAAAGGTPTLPGNTAVRFVLLSPIRHEDLRAVKPGLPDPAPHNALLEQYSKAIEELAKERGAGFVDLFKIIGSFQAQRRIKSEAPITDNSIHLSSLGYRDMATAVLSAILPGGMIAPSGPETLTPLRAAVLKKNELFFHRFRPENATYLFGFRKHEQGQNAKEIPMFDPLIEQADAAIEGIKRANAPVAPSAPKIAAVPVPGAPLTPPPLPDFTVQDSYQIALWAENPFLEKPTQMNWDALGRLWVCSSSLYPQIEPGQEMNDKILILEDTDRDGKADKSSIFADGLLIPTAVVPDLLNVKGAMSPAACYVGQSTELLRFEDTDGDGKAETRKVVFSGFGTEDTHHLIHTLKWGPDGRLYWNQSIYIHSHLETPYGMVRLNSGGIFAYDPRTERVEVLAKGWCNPWGHAWDQWGQSFTTDGAGGQGVSWVIPGAMYFTYENGRKIAPSISPGSYPKFASLELIHSPHFPADWQGNAVTNDFRAHRIVRFSIEDLATGPEPKSGYVTKEQPDLVRTSDQSFRPIDVRLGPDGALYVADWSNPVINHGEVDFRDPRRDHHMGRIWRISKKDAPVVKWEPLVGKTTPELLERLLSKSAWEQQGARRVLVARDKQDQAGEAAQLNKALQNAPANRYAIDIAPNESVQRSLHSWKRAADSDANAWLERNWVKRAIDGFGGVGPLLLKSEQPQLRAIAVRELGVPSKEVLRDAENSLVHQYGEFVADPAPRVRLEAMRALSRIPTAWASALVLTAALNAPKDDALYDYAAWLSINDLAKPWTEAIASGTWKADTEARGQQLAWGLKNIDPALAGATLSRLVTENKVPLDGSGPWFELLGSAGGANEIDRLWTRVQEKKTEEINTPRILTALADAAKLRGVRPTLPVAELANYLDTEHAETLRAAARLAGAWKSEAAVPRLVALTAGKDDVARNTAFEALREIGSEPARAALRQLAAAPNAPHIRGQAVAALAALDFNPALITEALAAQPDEAAALPVWRGLLAVKDAGDRLAAALPKELPKPVALAGLRAAREAGKNGAKLLAALTPLAGVSEAEAKMPKDFKALAGFAKQNGDPARGEMIYRRMALGCTTCHSIGGAGGKVGPDMTSMGASAPLDYIIESVLAPALKVKEGFNAVTFTLKDGTQATGIQARETAQEIFLRDVTGHETTVAKAQITATTNIGSIMPAGLTDALQDRERLDLFAFLGELGKPGPYDASKGTVARVWKLFPGADAEKVIGGTAPMEAAFPGYTLVDGRFVKDLLAVLAPVVANGDTMMCVAQFQSTGKTRLKLTGAGKAWLDGKPLVITDDLAPELSAGIHTIAVKLDVKTLPEYLRAESPDARFLGN